MGHDPSQPEPRHCAWCHGPIRPAARRDAITCSKACRQAKARFRVAPAGTTADRPMTFAYADPPYPGLARKYYGTDEVDHEKLVTRMRREFPDGWALSTSSEALRDILAMCPAGARVASWVKGQRRGLAWRPRSAWEPLIVVGGRPQRIDVTEDLCDVLLWGGRQSSHPGALVGMKPAAFAEWMFRQLGAMRGDELADLFPGSGAIGRAWGLYTGAPGGGDGSVASDVARDGSGALAAPSDASREYSSRAAPRDTSTRYRDDASPAAGADTSPRGTRDTSCLASAARRLRERLVGND